MRRRLSALVTLVGAAIKADTARTIGLVATTVSTAIGTTVSALGLKLLVDGAIGRDLTPIVVGALALGASQSVLWVVHHTNFSLGIRVDEATGHLLQERLLRATLAPDGIAHYESEETLKRLELLQSEADWLGQAGSAIAWPAGSVLGLGAVTALLISVDPLLVGLPILTLPAVLASNRSQRLMDETSGLSAEGRRAARGLFDVATSARAAKEIRLLGLGDALVDRHARIWAAIEKDEAETRTRSVWWSVMSSLLFAAGYAASLLFVGVRVLQALATPGDLILTFVVGGQLGRQISNLTVSLPRFLRALDRIGLLHEIEGATPGRTATTAVATLPPFLSDGLRLNGVRFRYPGTEADVLSGIDLHLPANSVVALVGANGAGKTTLTKLLLRLYEPTAGHIAVDGTDLQRIPAPHWRQGVAGGFQDFVQFELVAREVVGVGDLPSIHNEGAVRRALRDAAAEDVLAALPDALETQLGRSFDDGHEPSRGQWQKLALGRAMMRRHPLLLVLDEPTASLDAETEYALFEHYANAARHVAGKGGITLLVTHRFSTVRSADLLVVLDRGRVVEVGRHADLIARQGLYAELYELQARAYR